MTERTYADDLQLLIGTLPRALQDTLKTQAWDGLLEIILDLGRPPQARYPQRAVSLSDEPVSLEDIDQVVAALGEFGADNRAGIAGTLHRISAIRNRKGRIIGLTLRVGRAVSGTIDLIRDLVEADKSVLMLGRPGVGKTTKLREIARVLADEFNKRVIVIDTSNEIAGDGDISHPAIGGARRMQVAHPAQQHAVMIEAVENHMPEVIVIDEIGTAEEATAARTIAERGVQLIGTAHGNILENLVNNPTLSDLIGGIQTVTLGDEEARQRGTQKTVTERKAAPTFTAVVEIVNRDEVIVHADSAEAVDRLLRGKAPGGVRRTPQGESLIEMADFTAAAEKAAEARITPLEEVQGTVRIYPYAISRDSVERVLRDLRLDARTVSRPEQAHAVIALRSRADDIRLRRIVQATGLPLHLVKKNSTAQIRRLLLAAFNVIHGVEEDEVAAARLEAEAAALRVMQEGVMIELAPQPATLRKLQHRIVTRHRLIAESVGCEPQRHLVIHPHAYTPTLHETVTV